MTFIEAVGVLSSRWQEMAAELDEQGKQLLDTLTVQHQRAVGDRELSRIWHEIVDLALTRLPAASGVRRDLLTALDVPRLKSGAGEATLPPLPVAVPATLPSIEDWIVAAKAYSPAHVRRTGADPDQPGLIRIRRPDGRVSLPAFQFTRAGELKPLVLRINRLLGADDDPWGVADWWLCPNVWLGATPAEVLGAVDDDVLVAAAAVVTEG